ncbi:MAG: type I-C CRISPR-associated protein Cas8c/Csd1 [Planctomycetaceae bacterium]|nr:type I-C CRISPR-associated protein Cas8c/Csd1 [Planctomycetaceae bacterium]
MILQALKEYYDRKASDTDSDIAPPGWEWKEIPYIIVLDGDGLPTDVQSTVQGTGKNKTTKRFLVPQSVVRSVGVVANLLWDTPEYTTGAVVKGKPERVERQHHEFKEKVFSLGDIDDAGLHALKKFLERTDKEALLEKFEGWQELKEKGFFHAFKLKGTDGIISDSLQVRQAINSLAASGSGETENKSLCLVTGEPDDIELTHAKIKGVWGGQTIGGTIVGVNFAAAQSFCKEQGAVSPVGKRAAFAFATALNMMLAKGSKNRMQVADASTVAWASKETDFEGWFISALNEPPKDNPDEGVGAVSAIYKSIESGAFRESDGSGEELPKFYVLGLAPNAARISIRFWIVDTVETIAKRVKQHFDDLNIVHSDKQPEYLSLFRLLISTAGQGKSENIPPNLGGEVMRSILEGLPYPATLLNAALRRICAERDVSYPRAAIIKAFLNRFYKRNPNPQFKEITVSLDKDNTNPGYLLGRLFAVLEKIQEEAVNPKATIRDRFYAAASGTPASVFSNLMRLKNHHLSKLDNVGQRINFEKLLGEIIGGIDGMKGEFPSHLSLHDQGCFAIGYYHQRQDFFKPAKKKGDAAGETEAAPDDLGPQY